MSKLLNDRKRLAAYALTIILFIVIAVFAPSEKVDYDTYQEVAESIDMEAGEVMPEEYSVYYGPWTLVIPVFMFIFVMLTRSFLEAFLWADFLAVFMRFRTEIFYAYTEEQVAAFLNYDNARLIILYLTIGSILAAVARGGGAIAFANWVKSKAKSPKVSLVVMWLLDIVLSIDDELSAFTTGAAITPIADGYNIPREKSATIIRLSAVSAANIWPLGAWAIFVASLLEINSFAESGRGIIEFMKCVPFMFFPIIILIVGILLAIGVIPEVGVLKRASERVKNGGPIIPDASGLDMADKTDIETAGADDDTPKRMINFFFPIAALLIGAAISGLDILVGIIISLVLTFILFVVQKIVTPAEYIGDILCGGMRDMVMLTALFATSLVLVNQLDIMGFAPYVVSITAELVSAKFLPLIIFIVFACTEFLVSFNWTLYMMALPIIIPLAEAVGANPYLCIAALVCSGIWGSQGCLYSDGALVAAAATGTDVYASSTASFPYAFASCILSAIGFLIAGLIM